MEPLQTDEKKLILKSPLFRGISEAELSGVLEGLSAQRRTFPAGGSGVSLGGDYGNAGDCAEGKRAYPQEDFWGNSTILAQSGRGICLERPLPWRKLR